MDSSHASDPAPDLPEVNRVVSLVPSLTEAVAATAPGVLVGATDWCTHPADLDVTRVRGTKNPDLDAIIALEPDLVVANREENRRLDVERLRERGVRVHVTVIDTLDEAFDELAGLSALLRAPEPGWLAEARAVWARAPELDLTAVVPIWRDPWMVVGERTFTADLLARLGVRVLAPGERYPHTTPEEIAALDPDVVVLPDEPYRFTPEDGPEAFPTRRVRHVDGRLLTWYGPSLVEARSRLGHALVTT
ncbi:helical backbone metal receptor [Mariniluteicoccus endophyticus]